MWPAHVPPQAEADAAMQIVPGAYVCVVADRLASLLTPADCSQTCAKQHWNVHSLLCGVQRDLGDPEAAHGHSALDPYQRGCRPLLIL